MASQQSDAPESGGAATRRSPLPSAGELDAAIAEKLQQWDASRKREGKPASSNGGGK